MTDQLRQLLIDQAAERINTSVVGIETELNDSEDGELAVSIAFRVKKLPDKLCCGSTLSYSRKFKDECEGFVEIDDPDQPKLEGITVYDHGKPVQFKTGKEAADHIVEGCAKELGRKKK